MEADELPGPPWPAAAQAAAYLQLPRFLTDAHRRYGDRFIVRAGALGTFVYLAETRRRRRA